MKFSIFPEFIKNVGTAVLFPAVQWYHVFITTIVHGGLFTTVWAAIGHEAMMELQQQTTSTTTTATATTPMISPPKWIYRIMIPSVLTLGMGLPVVTMAWWARQLRKEQHKQEQQQQAAATTTAAATTILSLKRRKKTTAALASSSKTLPRDDERPKRRWFGR